MPVSFYRCVVYVSVTCVLPLSLFAASGGLSKESIDFEGNRHEYLIFVPKMNTGSAPAPMLVLLHGSGHDGRSLLYPWKKLAARKGVVLVAPNAQNAAGWQSPADGPGALISIAGAVKKQYGVDANRVYLFGHSAGAVFALLMSLWEPRYFAAVAVHAGAIPSGTEGQIRSALHAAKRKTPIQIQVGTEDPFFPVQAVRTTRDLFSASGFPIDLREIPRHDHNYYAVSDQINREAWAFMKERTLTAESQ
jgi:poly(3-hydroxybutyrate) depolymerase